MKTKLILTPDELNNRVVYFYSRYNNEIEDYKINIVQQLQKIVTSYLKEKNLPKESMNILARTKTINSSLKKIKHKGWPQFDFLPEIITDLIGTRIVCWFLDDCYGIEKYIKQSKKIKIVKIENYITEPKKSGYRAIHLTSRLINNVLDNNLNMIESPLLLPFNYEIQIETKLQEAWSDISHEFYIQSKNKSIINKNYESFLEKSAERLFNEDKIMNKFKIIWHTIKDENVDEL
jgi:putative GTP pyrophosphokinase